MQVCVLLMHMKRVQDLGQEGGEVGSYLRCTIACDDSRLCIDMGNSPYRKFLDVGKGNYSFVHVCASKRAGESTVNYVRE